MEIGIDVGGTFTDAVLIEKGEVLTWTKVPTNHDNVLDSLISALDRVLQGYPVAEITRLSISTTLITNLIVEKKYEPVALLLIPGPGLNMINWDFQTYTKVLKGTVDFRGHLIEDINIKELKLALDDIDHEGFHRVAVVSKFSVRNPRLERAVAERIIERHPFLHVELGHKVAGELNFPRRVASTLLTAATRDTFSRFVTAVNGAVKERELRCPVYIMKADGGTIPLKEAMEKPIETIFSGPAASVLGTMAMLKEQDTAVVVDTGGTTTDIALILAGKPLLSSKGAKIGGYDTQVRAFAVDSVPVGGDSTVEVEKGQLIIRPYRQGPAACQGGPMATPTDALQVLGLVNLGNPELSFEAVSRLAVELNTSVEATAQQIADTVASKVQCAIEAMFKRWQDEPAYRLWELEQRNTEGPKKYLGVGGAGCIALLAAELAQVEGIVPLHGKIANAIGAAVACPTVTCTLRADTEIGSYTIEEDGSYGEIKSRQFDAKEAQNLAENWLVQKGKRLGLDVSTDEVEILSSEVFNVIRGYSTVGRIYHLKLQTPRKIASLSLEGR